MIRLNWPRRELLVELSDIQRHVRHQLGLTIEPAMAAYIYQMLELATANAAPPAQIPVIGADARTGVAVRRLIPVDSFSAVQS